DELASSHYSTQDRASYRLKLGLWKGTNRRGGYVRFGSKADICSAKRYVRFTPKSRHVRCSSRCPLWAKSGHRAASFDHLVAATWRDGGTVKSRALAIWAGEAVCCAIRPDWTPSKRLLHAISGPRRSPRR